MSLCVDTCPQARRRLDVTRSAPRERDGTLLLGKPLGKLRRSSDALVEGGTALRRERAVGGCRQLFLARPVPPQKSQRPSWVIVTGASFGA